MHGERRFSQAIAEGDGISLVAEAADPSEAARAAEDGARALATRTQLGEVPLPVLSRAGGAPGDAHRSGADAWVLVSAAIGSDDERLERLYAEVVDLGLDCVVEVGDEDELERVLERLDPEVFLLSGRNDDDDDPLEQVLELLDGIPAGKLAVAEVGALDEDTLAALERAGVDAVIVPAAALADIPRP
jgi:Indole-3-glycerol phosphate synthase